jgi:ABC-type branched-subunit amino acid transport system permease subunit
VRILSDELLLGFGEWDIAIYGLILMVVMIFMPEGLFVKIKEIFERWRLRYRRKGAET